MSATAKAGEFENDTIDKFTEGLLSTMAHLMGYREDANNGKLNVTITVPDDDYRSCVNIENINLQTAQQWEAGALLNTVADMKLLSMEKIQKIRREVDEVEVLGPGSSNFTTTENKTSKTAAAKAFNQEDPFAFSKGPSGFYPPRKTTSNNNNVKNDISTTELVQRKQFTFVKPTTTAEEFPPKQENNASSSKTSFFSVIESPPRKKSALELRNRPDLIDPSTNNMSYQNSALGLGAGGQFMTANQKLMIEDKRKGIQRALPPPSAAGSGNVRVPGLTRPPPRAEPLKQSSSNDGEKVSDNPEVQELMTHESMKNIEPKMVEAILNEVMQVSNTEWDDIAGLDNVKRIISEIIIWPMQRPDIFNGLRAAPRGILFFGPPGTGKTMFGRVIATQSKSTFFNISASSLTSKWIGDGEKMVRALFAVARLKQPSVIFIDEIDSILTQRSDTEHESSRRLKTEFLIQFDGCATNTEDRILVIGVTNRPQELDEAARRRLVKRIYIPLPDVNAREQLVRNLIKEYSSDLTDEDFVKIAKMTEGYSGADMTSLCREAAYGPIREVGHRLQSLELSEVRSMRMRDFVQAHRQVKSSVGTSDVQLYKDWDSKFGCQMIDSSSNDSSQFSQTSH